MTLQQFEEAASHCHERAYYTGEEHFIHCDALMKIEGWSAYGSPGFGQLTVPQQVLIMWSDLVGQTQNGGFTQFVDNFRAAIPLADSLIPRLDWPDLAERFRRALVEQVGDPQKPVWWEPVYKTDENGRFVERTDLDPRLALYEGIDRRVILNAQDRPPEDEAEAFNDWFYKDSTREQARIFVGAFVRRNRDLLCRIQD
jgi:hypothetical protein